MTSRLANETCAQRAIRQRRNARYRNLRPLTGTPDAVYAIRFGARPEDHTLAQGTLVKLTRIFAWVQLRGDLRPLKFALDNVGSWKFRAAALSNFRMPEAR